MRPQEGLLHSPGQHSALVLWTLGRTGAARHLREAARGLCQELAPAPEVHALLALEAGLHCQEAPAHQGPPLLPRGTRGARLPSTQAQVLLQLAASSRERLLWALRRAAAHFSGLLTLQEDLLGARIAEGREPFGFPDALRPPTGEQVRSAAVVASGPLSGASWLLYLRFQQDLESFARLRPRAQCEVMGLTPEGEALARLPEDSHLARVRAAGAGPAQAFIRRGFPFRQGGEEGLAFVAASADPLRYHRALDALLGADGGPPDALLRYATAVGGGLYLAPARDWLLSPEGDP